MPRVPCFLCFLLFFFFYLCVQRTNGLGSAQRKGLARVRLPAGLGPVVAFDVGSLQGAAICLSQASAASPTKPGGSQAGEPKASQASKALVVWGDGWSGNLGLGVRAKRAVPPTVVPFPPSGQASGHTGAALQPVTVACSRAGPLPKRILPKKGAAFQAGQEGPRCHVIASDGSLWISGTTHKGLGADHLSKVMAPAADHLNFYRYKVPILMLVSDFWGLPRIFLCFFDACNVAFHSAVLAGCEESGDGPRMRVPPLCPLEQWRMCPLTQPRPLGGWESGAGGGC